MKKVFAVAALVVGLSAVGAAPALASSYAYSTDSNQGSLAQYTSVNRVITAYDQAYDGWGASAQVYYDRGGAAGLNAELGAGTSFSARIADGMSFKFKSCLEHNNGSTLAYCSGLRADS